MTPAPNRSFLAGITRRRVIALLREAGVEVRRDGADGGGFPRRRRDLLHRQLFQGRADHADRGSRAAARPAAREGAEALLGMGARVSVQPASTGSPSPRRVRRDGVACAALPSARSRDRAPATSRSSSTMRSRSRRSAAIAVRSPPHIGPEATWYGEFAGNRYDDFTTVLSVLRARMLRRASMSAGVWQNEAMILHRPRRRSFTCAARRALPGY